MQWISIQFLCSNPHSKMHHQKIILFIQHHPHFYKKKLGLLKIELPSKTQFHFTRRYSGNHRYFLFLCLLRCFNSTGYSYSFQFCQIQKNIKNKIQCFPIFWIKNTKETFISINHFLKKTKMIWSNLILKNTKMSKKSKIKLKWIYLIFENWTSKNIQSQK